jgi:hypothetical protein
MRLGHIVGNQRPYPVVLKEFLKIGLMPVFGLTIDDDHLSKSVKNCKKGL